ECCDSTYSSRSPPKVERLTSFARLEGPSAYAIDCHSNRSAGTITGKTARRGRNPQASVVSYARRRFSDRCGSFPRPPRARALHRSARTCSLVRSDGRSMAGAAPPCYRALSTRWRSEECDGRAIVEPDGTEPLAGTEGQDPDRQDPDRRNRAVSDQGGRA